MSDARQINGQCLCGDVTVSAMVTSPKLRACHCEMCRRHTSAMFMSITTLPEQTIFNGPVQSYRSSEWAERGFCRTCGSTIYYGTVADGVRNLAAGLFDRAGDATMTAEFFADNCPSSYALAGNHKKLSAQETIALFAPEEGDDA